MMKDSIENFYLPLLLIVVMCATLATAFSAQAEPGAGPGFKQMSRGFGPHRMFKLLHKLDVSREQRTAIGEVMDTHRPMMREFMFDMMDGKKALQAILTSENYDPKQIEDLAAAQAANAEKMFLATAKSFAEISAILTPEQRKELAKMMESRGGRWGGHRRDDDRDPM